MARRDESLLNLLVERPWGVSVLASGIAFVFVIFRFILPSVDFRNKGTPSVIKSTLFTGVIHKKVAPALKQSAKGVEQSPALIQVIGVRYGF